MSGELKSSNCPSCGGVLKISPRAKTVQCEFCGKILHVKQSEKVAQKDEQIENHLVLAESAIQAGDFEEANNYYTKALDSDPTSFRAWMGRARATMVPDYEAEVDSKKIMSFLDRTLYYAPDDEKATVKKELTNHVGAYVREKYQSWLHAVKTMHWYDINVTANLFINQCLELTSMICQCKEKWGLGDSGTFETGRSICKTCVEGLSFTPSHVLGNDGLAYPNSKGLSESRFVIGDFKVKIESTQASLERYLLAIDSVKYEAVFEAEKKAKLKDNIKIAVSTVLTVLFLIVMLFLQCNRTDK